MRVFSESFVFVTFYLLDNNYSSFYFDNEIIFFIIQRSSLICFNVFANFLSIFYVCVGPFDL